MNVARGKPLPRLAVFFIVVLVFVFIGPAIGGVLVGVGLAALIAAGSTAGPETVLLGSLWFALMAIFFGYLLGLAPALLAGVIVAGAGIWKKWNGILVPVLAGGIAGLFGRGIGSPFDPEFFRAPDAGLYLFACLVAALACWYLTRGIVRTTWQSA